MVQTLCIVLIGQSVYRPFKVIKECNPNEICLITSSQPDWKHFTNKISDRLKDLNGKRCSVTKLEADMTNYDSVFKIVFKEVDKWIKSTNGHVHIDASATTGIAMTAGTLVSCLYNNVTVHSVPPSFKPPPIDEVLEKEEQMEKQINQQVTFDIPTPKIPLLYSSNPKSKKGKKKSTTQEKNRRILVELSKMTDYYSLGLLTEKVEGVSLSSLSKMKATSKKDGVGRLLETMESMGLVEQKGKIWALTTFGKGVAECI